MDTQNVCRSLHTVFQSDSTQHKTTDALEKESESKQDLSESEKLLLIDQAKQVKCHRLKL